MTRYKIEGITDERDSCDCCGKTGLKRTVALTDLDTSEIVYFGTSCAAQSMKIPSADVRKESRKAQDEKDEAARLAKEKANREEFKKWSNFLTAKTGGDDVFLMIQSLGGIAKARQLYLENQ